LNKNKKFSILTKINLNKIIQLIKNEHNNLCKEKDYKVNSSIGL
jgi:hypothetical protein